VKRLFFPNFFVKNEHLLKTNKPDRDKRQQYLKRTYCGQALDMLRKLALVGLVLMVGRGSVAQLSVAIILSFGFFALHMYTMCVARPLDCSPARCSPARPLA
jgi:hypothetical protein